jgi:hypothetical protein
MSQLADDANLELSQKRQKWSTTRDRSKPKVTNIFFVSCWIFQSTLISFNAFLSNPEIWKPVRKYNRGQVNLC